MARLDSLIGSGTSNAALSWVFVGILTASISESLLEGDILWALFSAVVITVAVIPAVQSRDYSVMVSWEILLLSALPAFARLVDAFTTPLGYLSVAALGLLVVAEIDQFTPARMAGWFAGALVIMTTMSVASSWIILRYFANRLLGTAFVTTVDALMWDLIVASTVGIVFGVVFELVFREQETA